MQENHLTLKAYTYDLDWNRHVTSRTYEKFTQEGRNQLLAQVDYPIERCIEENIFLIPVSSEIRFLNQQFAGSTIGIQTKGFQIDEDHIYWKHNLVGQDFQPCAELSIITKVNGKKNLLEEEFAPEMKNKIPNHIKEFSGSSEQLVHDFKCQFSDLNPFITYSPDAIWKIFEEGRWLFFNEVIDLKLMNQLDTTSFFMGGQIQVFKMPLPGEKISLHSWLESIEKIRFYFRQDIKNESGEVLVSMRDEQLFVSLTKSRPRKAPSEFIKIVERYLENKSI